MGIGNECLKHCTALPGVCWGSKQQQHWGTALPLTHLLPELFSPCYCPTVLGKSIQGCSLLRVPFSLSWQRGKPCPRGKCVGHGHGGGWRHRAVCPSPPSSALEVLGTQGRSLGKSNTYRTCEIPVRLVLLPLAPGPSIPLSFPKGNLQGSPREVVPPLHGKESWALLGLLWDNSSKGLVSHLSQMYLNSNISLAPCLEPQKSPQ